MDPIALQSDLAAEANHRIANSLTMLGGLVRMQAKFIGRDAKPFSNAEVRLVLDGIAARIASLGQLHRLVAHLPPDGVVILNQHLREVAANLTAAFSSKERPVHIEHQGVECPVLARHVQPLTLILCEALTNAMKYSHPGGLPVKIVLLCEALPDGMLQVTVSDDGVGLPEGFDTAKDGSLGFQVMRALTGELGAHLDILSDSLGVTFRLKVPQMLVASLKSA